MADRRTPALGASLPIANLTAAYHPGTEARRYELEGQILAMGPGARELIQAWPTTLHRIGSAPLEMSAPIPATAFVNLRQPVERVARAVTR